MPRWNNSNCGFQKGHLGWNKGKKMLFKHRKMADDFILVNAFKKGSIPWNKGKKCNPLSVEHKIKISKTNKGGNKTSFKKGCIPKNWKGEHASYAAFHQWIKRKLGMPKKCQICGSVKNIQWANKSHQYKRDLNDWLQLCIKCHRKYDGLVGDWRNHKRPTTIKNKFKKTYAKNVC